MYPYCRVSASARGGLQPGSQHLARAGVADLQPPVRREEMLLPLGLLTPSASTLTR